MKRIIVATSVAVWAAFILPVAPGRAIAAPYPCDALGVEANFDCADPVNPGGPMQPAPPPSGPTHVHCDCVKLVDDHSEPCCP